jgi:hypothetical protein
MLNKTSQCLKKRLKISFELCINYLLSESMKEVVKLITRIRRNIVSSKIKTLDCGIRETWQASVSLILQPRAIKIPYFVLIRPLTSASGCARLLSLPETILGQCSWTHTVVSS